MLSCARRLVLLITAFAAGACASPPPRPAPLTSLPAPLPPPAQPAEAPPDPAILCVAVVQPPQKATLDGDLRAWGPLVSPPAPPKPPPDPDADKDGPDAPVQLPTPPDLHAAASHLGFALTLEAARIAVELAAPAPQGIWLGVGALPAVLPTLATSVNGLVWEAPECSTRTVPEPCKAEREAYARFEAAHKRRFQRMFKIDRDGVRVVAEGGALVTIAGARVAARAGEHGASTLEVWLPLAAMPRVAQSPVQTLALVARVASSPEPPELAPEQWSWLTLPAPISFEPYGELRARVLAAVRWRAYRATPLRPEAGLSYQPGEPSKLEGVAFGGDSIGPTFEGKLYEKTAALGDVEVGEVHASETYLAVFKGGKLIDLVDVERAEPRGEVERNGELHLFWYRPRTFRGGSGFESPSWSVIAVTRDGKTRQALDVDGLSREGSRYAFLDSATEILNKGKDTFGFRAVVSEGGNKKVGVESILRWDAATGKYTGGEWRVIPVAKALAKGRSR